MSEYLTTKEVAQLLRIKERKVYDLAASGTIPHSKPTGKLLFPRHEVMTWLSQNSAVVGLPSSASRPPVFLGSHDPLLDWALRESRCGLACLFDSSMDGLKRFNAGEGIAAGLHIRNENTDGWNVEALQSTLSSQPVVLLEWAKRDRGLIFRNELAGKVESIADLQGLRFVPRQSEAGSQKLFENILLEQGIGLGSISFLAPARSETDAALVVQEGEGDATFGLQAIAENYRLTFVPIVQERFDIILDRKAHFDTPIQTFLAFCRSERFQQRAAEMPGYDISKLGTVHYNGP